MTSDWGEDDGLWVKYVERQGKRLKRWAETNELIFRRWNTSQQQYFGTQNSILIQARRGGKINKNDERLNGWRNGTGRLCENIVRIDYWTDQRFILTNWVKM